MRRLSRDVWRLTSPTFRLRSLVATLAFLIILAAADKVSAAAFVVTRIDDRGVACAVGDCSLREAVDAANLSAAADTITFVIPAGCTAGVCTITLGAQIEIEVAGGPLTITGTGAEKLTVDGGAGTNRIFFSNGATASISGMTLTGGNGEGNASGGAIFATGGALTLDGVHITGNNTATTASGGGVEFVNGANQIFNSTFSANSAGSCGGYFNNNGTLTVLNSTISGNTSAGVGGGVCNSGTSTFRSVTVTANTATGNGGGVFQDVGSLNIGNSIIAGNNGAIPDIRKLAGTTITTVGYNLIGINTDVATEFPAGNPNTNNDIVGTAALPVNPQLGALTDNAGTNRVPTHAIAYTSPALDKGNSFGLTTDERGIARPTDYSGIPNAPGGDGADIGAYELLAPSAAGVSVGGRVLTAGGRGVSGAIVELSGGALGTPLRAISSPLGYYRFETVTVGEGYVINVTSKRYQFAPRFIVVDDELLGFDIVAEP